MSILSSVDKAMIVQRPLVVAHVRRLRRKFPGATPAQLVKVLERHYLAAVTTGGAAVGATAVVPGIGTGISLALSGVETLGFLETTGLFALSVAEIHGITLTDPDRARALVMTLMLGNSGNKLLTQLAGQGQPGGAGRSEFWAGTVSDNLPQILVGPAADLIKREFLKRFAVSHGSSIVGKAAPFGIGAAIGGIGNHILGRQVVAAARATFGPTPFVLPVELEPQAKSANSERKRMLALPRKRR